MTAMFDLLFASTSKSIHMSPTVLQDPENVGYPLESRCYLLYKLNYTTLHMYSRLMAAMLDLPVNRTFKIIHSSPTVYTGPRKGGVAV